MIIRHFMVFVAAPPNFTNAQIRKVLNHIKEKRLCAVTGYILSVMESLNRATASLLQGECEKNNTGKKSIAQQEKLNFTTFVPLLPR